jgi:methyl-accepting chemotaxis protein
VANRSPGLIEMRFTNFSLLTQIAAPLALAVTLGAGVLVAATSMTTRKVDDAYTTLIDGQAASTLALTRSTQLLSNMNRLVLQAITETDSSTVQGIAAAVKQLEQKFKETARAGKDGAPQFAEKIDAMLAKFDKTLKPAVEQTLELAAKNDDAQALIFSRSTLAPGATSITNGMLGLVKDAQAAMEATKSETHAGVLAALEATLIGTAAGFAALLALLFVIVRSTASRPLVALSRSMSRLAEGDLDAEVRGAERGDEIGAMARALATFRENAIRVRALEAEQERLKLEGEEDRRSTMQTLADNFTREVQGIVQGVGAAARQLEQSARDMKGSAEEGRERSGVVAGASQEATANVETVAASAEELTASIQEIARQVAEASAIAGEATSQASGARNLVTDLAATAQKIGDVVSLINDIAAQTNLLALSATIEAARAGEAGRGFAVVAAEVKYLATQTAKATEEIAHQIHAVQGATKEVVGAITHIDQTIGRINEISSAVAAAVEEQDAATREIARNVEEAARGTQEVSANIASVRDSSSRTGEVAGQILAAAGDLTRQADTLNEQVEAFVGRIRAA